MYDMNNLKQLGQLGKNADKAMKAFQAFDSIALEEGAIPVKYKELIISIKSTPNNIIEFSTKHLNPINKTMVVPILQ